MRRALGGGPPVDSDGRGYALTIRDGDFTAAVNVYLPWSTPPVSVGDTVELDYFVQSGGIETPPSGSLTLRDNGNELLLWFLNASFGFDEFESPKELTVESGASDPFFHTVKLAAVRGSKASLDARDLIDAGL